MACAPSKDQPGNPPRSVFAVCMKKAWVLSNPLSAQRRLRSDWVDALADLSLRWAHTHFWFFHVAVQFLFLDFRTCMEIWKMSTINFISYNTLLLWEAAYSCYLYIAAYGFNLREDIRKKKVTTCHKLWIDICEIWQIFKGDFIIFGEIFTKPEAHGPQWFTWVNSYKQTKA